MSTVVIFLIILIVSWLVFQPKKKPFHRRDSEHNSSEGEHARDDNKLQKEIEGMMLKNMHKLKVKNLPKRPRLTLAKAIEQTYLAVDIDRLDRSPPRQDEPQAMPGNTQQNPKQPKKIGRKFSADKMKKAKRGRISVKKVKKKVKKGSKRDESKSKSAASRSSKAKSKRRHH